MTLLAFAAPAFAQAPSITDVDVTPTPFSPNGDGVRDLLYVKYTLDVEATSVTAAVRDSDGAHVAVLLQGAYRAAGTDTLIWNGETDDLGLAPDGYYTVHLSARNQSGQTEEDSPLFVLDATRPIGRIAEVYPKPFSPGLPASPDSLRVRVEVSGADPGDSLAVTITALDEPDGDLLSLTPPFAGAGEYVGYWRDKGDDDGFYTVSVFMQDVALNRSTDQVSFILDRNPPIVEITDPTEGAVFSVLPDLFYGKAYDESEVDSIEVSYDGGPFATVPGVSGSDTLFWSSPLGDLLTGTGELTVSVRATDSLGRVGARGYQEGAYTLTLTVVTDEPDPPILDPLPAVVRTSRLTVSGTATEADSVYVYLNDSEIPAARLNVTIKDTFEGIVDLKSGPNDLVAVSLDEAGNQSEPSFTVTVEYSQEFGVFFGERFRPGDNFEISLDTTAREVQLALYSMSGRFVRLLRGDGPSTYFNLVWDGYDSSGTPQNSGVYLCRVSAVLEDGTTITQKKLVALVR